MTDRAQVTSRVWRALTIHVLEPQLRGQTHWAPAKPLLQPGKPLASLCPSPQITQPGWWFRPGGRGQPLLWEKVGQTAGVWATAEFRTLSRGPQGAGCLVAMVLLAVTPSWVCSRSLLPPNRPLPSPAGITRATPRPPWGTGVTPGQLRCFPLTLGSLLLNLGAP